MIRRLILLATLCLPGFTIFAQTPNEKTIASKLAAYFDNYSHPELEQYKKFKVDSVRIDEEPQMLRIYANKIFATQPFTPDLVRRVYHDIQGLVPAPFNAYPLTVYAAGTRLEELVPSAWGDSISAKRTWGDIEYKGNPWVTPLSLPNKVTQGLQGRHITVWASHGRYFENNQMVWKWQRPRLYCTTEDLFTQTFVVPFLMPMLQNAGAIVFTPRERDWQRNEVIVDNDRPDFHGTYVEQNGQYEWTEGGMGFAHLRDIYYDQENPFMDGTIRQIDAQTQKRQSARAIWTPEIPEDGEYAVYVSYQTLPTSVSDARYTVRHRGIDTQFRVNQQMGGGTWVYLGTFDFAAGNPADNCVSLSNQSNYRGVVTADAVRLGGGMGNIARGDSIHAKIRSGLPRYLEASRYTAQWYGMPYPIYGNKESLDDYSEDINVRSHMSNYVAAGSPYVPLDSIDQPGLRVPIELSLAVHSDAGSRHDESIVGTLGIYTTGFYDGLLQAGLSRLCSRDLCDRVMTQMDHDLSYMCGDWTRREMRDENYSESREPRVPSMILETLSHQNWGDMKRGHDPYFKFLLSRAVYKGILQYISTAHGIQNPVTQPLPVHDMAALLTAVGDSVTLSWQPTVDPLDSTAVADSYIVYTRVGEQGYDNGTLVRSNRVTLPLQRGQLHRYRVRAVNAGGTSMDSEELCAYNGGISAKRILIVNAFQRLAAPQPFDTDSTRGFDFLADPGVIYQRMPTYCGKQVYFDKDGFGKEGPQGLGNSGNEYEGKLLVGNTLNFPSQHAQDFLTGRTDISIASVSRGALDGNNTLFAGYQLVDIIAGAQRQDGYSMLDAPLYTPALCDLMRNVTHNGGSLLLSGAYVGQEIHTDGERALATDVLHFVPDVQYQLTDSTSSVQGFADIATLSYKPNEQQYSIPSASTIVPAQGAQPILSFLGNDAPCAVLYQSPTYRAATFGFPLECITDTQVRRNIVKATLDALLHS